MYFVTFCRPSVVCTGKTSRPHHTRVGHTSARTTRGSRNFAVFRFVCCLFSTKSAIRTYRVRACVPYRNFRYDGVHTCRAGACLYTRDNALPSSGNSFRILSAWDRREIQTKTVPYDRGRFIFVRSSVSSGPRFQRARPVPSRVTLLYYTSCVCTRRRV